ncbi:MAG: HDIG domain-containing protein [Anaerolineae bacterium]|nr:HDIG domain-containing protein [Anaerolineae bacterium]
MTTNELTPARAWEIVCEFVDDENLRRHMWAVGAAMRHYAATLGEDSDRWQAVGLLHDFDWEIHPDLDRHPGEGAPLLRERGVDEATIRTILSHNTESTGVERTEPIDFALLACDEITGLITAVALVRPSRDIRDVLLKSIRKKWKDLRFAAGVDRGHVSEVTDDFSRVCFDGELELWQHVGNVLEAMQGEASALGLDGQGN